MKRAECKVIISRVHCCTRRYFSETTLHGFRYVTDPKSSKFKSYFWALICAISTTLCFILIRSQFISYYSNRITTTIATTAFPIWEVPFPAVTICNFNLVYRDATKEFRELLESKISSDEINNFLENLSSLIPSTNMDYNIKWSQYSTVINVLRKAGFTTDSLMAKLSHPCNQMITDCYWNSKEKNCSEIFRLIKTTSGYCCSFNYKGINTTNYDELYVNGVGPSFGLSVRLNAEEDQYVSPLKSSFGVDVSVHETIQYPDMSLYGTIVRPGNDISLSVKPEITNSEKNVKGIDIGTRRCAFVDEIKMDWSRNYSYGSCIHQCKAKAIKELCQCIPYYYYSVEGKSRYCTLLDMACVNTNNVRFKGTKITYFQDKKNGYKTIKCKCYPQCNEVSYSYLQDQEPLKISQTESNSNDSILRVYFGHVAITKLQRSVLITWELILASVGGLIGLCLGGSILSVIEFFYHIFEAVFTRYKTPRKNDEKYYKPKLYLTDFVRVKKIDLVLQKNN